MVKINFTAGGCVPEQVGLAHIAHSKSLGLPAPTRGQSKRLAVVGGGQSSFNCIEALRQWPEDKWFIGSAFQWARSVSIGGTFFSCAASADAAPLCEGAAHAIVASCSHPEMFARLAGCAYVEVFDIENNGPTSAATVPWLALQMGYEEVRFYGCESSFDGTTHHYFSGSDWRSVMLKEYEMEVLCCGQTFRTCPEFYMQAQFLAPLMRKAPHVFVNCSGGLLGAMIADEDHDVIAGTPALYQRVAKSHDGITENR